MRLAVPYVELGPAPEAAALLSFIDPADWLMDRVRVSMGNIEQTRSIVLRHASTYRKEDIANGFLWPKYERLVDPFLDALRLVYRVRDFWAIFLAKLPAGAEVGEHVDGGSYLSEIHRVHIPLMTNPETIYKVDGAPINMEVGKMYEFDNLRPHGCVNRGSCDRVHLVVNVKE